MSDSHYQNVHGIYLCNPHLTDIFPWDTQDWNYNAGFKYRF